MMYYIAIILLFIVLKYINIKTILIFYFHNFINSNRKTYIF